MCSSGALPRVCSSRFVRKKFVRKADKQSLETQVFIADPLPLPIAKGIAGPGLLAETINDFEREHEREHPNAPAHVENAVGCAANPININGFVRR